MHIYGKKKQLRIGFKTLKRTRLTFQKVHLGERLKMAYSRPVYSVGVSWRPMWLDRNFIIKISLINKHFEINLIP